MRCALSVRAVIGDRPLGRTLSVRTVIRDRPLLTAIDFVSHRIETTRLAVGGDLAPED